MSDPQLVKQALPENSIQNTRLYAYSRQQVWNAIANADHLKVWWGPEGFTNTFHEFDLAWVVSGAIPCMVPKKATMKMK
jgi:uncharacterized protein YndB with AHSA1/START domain